MPKELSHWALAELTLQKLDNSELKKLLTDHRGEYLWGAVMYDTPFYAYSTEMGKKILKTGKRVHGTPPNNTLLPFNRLAKEYDNSPSPALLAFICGAFSHMTADIVFHPFVLYYSGSNSQRHLTFEGFLDCYFFQKKIIGKQNSVTGILKIVSSNRDDLLKWMSLFFDLPPDCMTELEKTIKRHEKIQTLFSKKWACLTLSFLAFLGLKEYENHKSLFYMKGLNCYTPFFHSDFNYRHPVTGEEFNTSINQLSDELIQKTNRFFSEIYDKKTAGNLESLFSQMAPLSLETGLDSMGDPDRPYLDIKRSINDLVFFK